MSAQHTQLVMTEAFQRGLSWGCRVSFVGSCMLNDWKKGVVEIIQNLVDFALEGPLTEEQLHQDIGILVGFVLDGD